MKFNVCSTHPRLVFFKLHFKMAQTLQYPGIECAALSSYDGDNYFHNNDGDDRDDDNEDEKDESEDGDCDPFL